MKIHGIEGLSASQLNFGLQRGGRFVIFQYTISVILITFYRPSDIYFIRHGEGSVGKSIGFTVLTLAAGWWGIQDDAVGREGAVDGGIRGDR